MKIISKKITFITCIVLIISSTFSTFATNVDTNTSNVANGTKKESFGNDKKEDTEMVIGKIISISDGSVTIEVATRNKKEKKTANVTGTEQNQTERQKPSDEDKYTLTGESKTFNISSTDFGRKNATEVNSESTDTETKGEKMTYTDYKIGDYVRITANKDTPTIAKRMRSADQGFNFNKNGKTKGNYHGGYQGSYTGKTKAEKQAQ